MIPPRDRMTARLEDWLEEGSTSAPDYVLDAVLDQVSTTPQQRGSWARVVSLAAAPALWGAAAAVAIAVLVLVSGPWLERGRFGSIDDPAATGTPIAARDLPDDDGPLAAGRYAVPSPFPSGIEFRVGDGWSVCSTEDYERSVCRKAGQFEFGVAFLLVEDVVADPCSGRLRDVPVGPGLDDLAEAIADLPGFETSPIEIRTLAGRQARELTLTAVSACSELLTWITPTRMNGVRPGEANRLVIVDVDGLRVVIAGTYLPGSGGLSADEQRALIEDVIESIRFRN